MLLLFIIATINHRLLYFVIPIFFVANLFMKRFGKIEFNKFNSSFILLEIVVLLFLLIQSFGNLSIEFYSLKGVARYTSYVAFALMISNISINHINIFFKCLIGFFIVTFPLGIYEYFTIGRSTVFFSHANHLAHVLVFCIYFLLKNNLYTTSLRVVIFFVLLLSVFLTKTSGALLVLLILAAYNFLFSKKITLRNKVFIVIGPLLIGLPIIMTFSDKIIEQLESLSYLEWSFIKERVEEFKPGGYGSFIWRIVYWIKILFSFMQENLFKILFGVGIDALTKGHMPYSYMYTDPHNDFLKILVEFGFVGLSMFLIFLRKIYLLTSRNIQLLVVILVPMLFDNAIVNFSFNLLFILIVSYEFRKNSPQIN